MSGRGPLAPARGASACGRAPSPGDGHPAAGEGAALAAEAAYVGPRHRWRVAWLARLLLEALGGAEDRGDPAGRGDARRVVLDLGCGWGSLSLLLAAKGLTVLALDRDPRRLAHLAARARALGLAERVLPCLADAQALPLGPAGLDGAVCGEVLEHLDDDRAALRGLAGALRPAAPWLLTVPAGPGRLSALDRQVGHRRRYDAAALSGLAAAADLRVERLQPWGFPFGRVYDRWVQAPALRRQAPAARRLLARLARLGPVDRLWQTLFRLDLSLGSLAPRAAGGWLVLGRSAAQEPPSRKA